MQGLEDIETKIIDLECISGMAPKCKPLSLKLFDDLSSNLIAAIEYIQHLMSHFASNDSCDMRPLPQQVDACTFFKLSV